MQKWLSVSLIAIAGIFILIALYNPCYCTESLVVSESLEIQEDSIPSPNPEIQGNVICSIMEYDQPPNDTEGPPSQDELNQIADAEESFSYAEDEESFSYAEDKESYEDFRISGGGGGRMGGGRIGGGRIGRMGGGGGRMGRRGGARMGRRGGGLSWPWRSWPRRHWGRPWRSNWWRNYPGYVYTYPLSYYNDYWEAPIRRFTIRIGPKGDRHPFADEGSDIGYMITTGNGTGCGTSGARLDLQYGQTYEFDIYTSKDCVTGKKHDQPFFFTTDKTGGSRVANVFNINPTINGTIRITITENLPKEFYYQSTNSEYVGGYVILHS